MLQSHKPHQQHRNGTDMEAVMQSLRQMPCLKAASRQKILMPWPHASCLGISLACLGLTKTASASVLTSLPQSRLG